MGGYLVSGKNTGKEVLQTVPQPSSSLFLDCVNVLLIPFHFASRIPNRLNFTESTVLGLNQRYLHKHHSYEPPR